MKKLCFIISVLLSLPVFSRDFSYTYKGQTLTYTVIDEEAKTCMTKEGLGEYSVEPGNNIKGALIIPEKVYDSADEYAVTKIGNYGFRYCDDLISVNIPESVTSIGSKAFYGCSGLTEVTIPPSVTSIGNYAFCSGSGLTLVYFNAENCKECGSEGFPAFPSSLSKVIIGEDVKTIPNNAFYDCRSLTEVTIPPSVTSIGNYAFYDCSGLTEMTIPASVTSIGNGAFSDCSGLTKVIIGNSVTSIGRDAFFYCSGLTEVTIPPSVTSIGSYAFCSGSGLTLVYFNAENCQECGFEFSPAFSSYIDKVIIGENVKTIPSYAFFGCSGLTEVTIPSSVASIGYKAFAGCSGLKNVDIENLESWIQIPFYNEDANPIKYSKRFTVNGKPVDTIYIDINKKTLRQYSFYNAQNLANVRIRCGRIRKDTFYGCSGIKNLCLDAETIDEYAFEYCKGIERIYSLTDTPPATPDNAFSNYKGVTLIVPLGSINSYKNAANCWWRFLDIYESDFSQIDDIFGNDKESKISNILSDNDCADIDYEKEYEIYSMNGVKLSGSISNFTSGMYVIRQGNAVKKIMVK